jgi:hypothetical protein
MSRGLPVPLRPEKPEVIVVTPARATGERRADALARFAVSIAPDVIDAVERALVQRRSVRGRSEVVSAAPAIEHRAYTNAVQFSDLEINTWSPFPRRVRLRTTTQWSTNTPVFSSEPADGVDGDHTPRLRKAGIGALGVGGAIALAVLANRGGRLKRR